MAEYIRNLEGNTNTATRRKPVASGVTVTDGDFVYQTGNSWSNASIAGKKLAGTVQGGDTQNLVRPAAAGVTVGDGTREVLVAIEKDVEYLVKCNAATVAADEGQYFNLVQGTGAAQVVDYASKLGTVLSLKMIKANPGIRGTDSTYGLFVIANNDRN